VNYVQRARQALLDELPDLDLALADLYVLLVLTQGEETSLQDVHDAWAVWRNDSNPDHRSLIPFDELALDVQELDREYMDAIHKAAQAIAR
jgi:hypothetical protein